MYPTTLQQNRSEPYEVFAPVLLYMIYFKLGYDFLSKIRLEKWQKQIDFGLEKSHTEKSNALLRVHCTV